MVGLCILECFFREFTEDFPETLIGFLFIGNDNGMYHVSMIRICIKESRSISAQVSLPLVDLSKQWPNVVHLNINELQTIGLIQLLCKIEFIKSMY